MSNIIQLGGKTEEQEKRIPEFQFEVRYLDPERKSDFIEGFLTVMGGYYFIGAGVQGDVNWLWSAPEGHVHSVISHGPAKNTRKLDA